MCADANKIRHFIAGWSKNSFPKSLFTYAAAQRKQAERSSISHPCLVIKQLHLWGGVRRQKWHLWKTLQPGIWNLRHSGDNLQRFNTNPQSHLHSSLGLPGESRVILPAKDSLSIKKNHPLSPWETAPNNQGKLESFYYPEWDKMVEIITVKT